MRCGLLGEKLGHSYSPQIHKELGNYSYSLFEVPQEGLGSFLSGDSFQGLNVTIPYKKAVIPYLDSLSPIAQKLGAVNTIVKTADNRLIGHNTDYFGFLSMISHSGLTVDGKKVLVLGSGGASNTVVSVLQQLNADVVVISRSGSNNYDNVSTHADASIIVNATPVGMYPNIGIAPVDLSQFPHLEGVLDLIYNPARTTLLLEAQARGLVTENGLWMLVAQAKESAEWFLQKDISEDYIPKIHNLLRSQMENVILIGMPGCGKSIIGQKLAAKLGKEFVDTDEVIVQMAGKSIPEIFQEDGEVIFRQWETKVLEVTCKRSGLIIATGGGCVTVPRNYPLLHQNGAVFWLKRDIRQLSTEGRPLSQSTPLLEMYHRREPMYQAFCDRQINNNGTFEDAVQQIMLNWNPEVFT